MQKGIVQWFRIALERRPNCKLTTELYSVEKKEQTNNGVFEVIFEATQNGVQIAESTCIPGFVKYVEVAGPPKIMMPGKIWKGLSARECGLSTVMTELCLIDPKLTRMYNFKKQNKALEELRDHPATLEHVTTYCRSLMAMQMSAKPRKGAHGYFSAARRTGYRRLLILANKEFYYFWTEDAQKLYDDSGNIGVPEVCCCNNGEDWDRAGSCNHGCDAAEKIWWFCKDNR